MARAVGGGMGGMGAATEAPPTIPPWEPTPIGHWRYWLGWTLRRQATINERARRSNHNKFYVYGRPQQVARQELARRYDEQTNTSGTGPWRQGKPSWHRPDILR